MKQYLIFSALTFVIVLGVSIRIAIERNKTLKEKLFS